MRSHYMNKEC